MIARIAADVRLSQGPMPWLTSFAIGERRIDDEHRILIAACNDLCALATLGNTAARARAAATELLASIESHFASEEELFQRIRFPNHRDHISEHDAIRTIVGALLLDGTGDFRIATATARVVLVEHIIRHDLGFKSYVQEARPGC